MADSTEDESADLKLHVRMCSLRYEHLESRLEGVEAKLDGISKSINNMRLDFFKVMVGTGGTIVVAVISAIALVLR